MDLESECRKRIEELASMKTGPDRGDLIFSGIKLCRCIAETEKSVKNIDNLIATNDEIKKILEYMKSTLS